jgi:hypothetical protein
VIAGVGFVPNFSRCQDRVCTGPRRSRAAALLHLFNFGGHYGFPPLIMSVWIVDGLPPSIVLVWTVDGFPPLMPAKIGSGTGEYGTLAHTICGPGMLAHTMVMLLPYPQG